MTDLTGSATSIITTTVAASATVTPYNLEADNMARTAVTYSSLVANSNLADPAGTALDATNDHTIASSEPERTLLRVTNTHSADHAITVKAGSYPPAIAAGLGDLSVTVAATSGVQWLGPFESGRFLQSDGSLHIDVPTGMTGTITAFLVPAAC